MAVSVVTGCEMELGRADRWCCWKPGMERERVIDARTGTLIHRASHRPLPANSDHLKETECQVCGMCMSVCDNPLYPISF